MISVFSFWPEYFNNNGDQGNLEALSHFTGEELLPAGIDEAQFVLFGDASLAAMREFNDELIALVPALQKRLIEGKPTLLVGSCYEFFAKQIDQMPTPRYGERVSEFREVTVGSLRAKGYRNSTWVAEDLFIADFFIGTTLFGPVLAKNPEVLELVAKGLNLEVSYTDSEREWISKL
jgi:hypothetical protein